MGKIVSQFRAKGPLRSMFRLFGFVLILKFSGDVLNAHGGFAHQVDLTWMNEIITYLLVSIATMTNPTIAHRDEDKGEPPPGINLS